MVTVDSSGAGEGQLNVTISNDGKQVPIEIQPEGRGIYRVHFMPNGSGVYSIRVLFAGAEVPGHTYSILDNFTFMDYIRIICIYMKMLSNGFMVTLFGIL